MENNTIFNMMSSYHDYSYDNITQTRGWYSNNQDIRWHANCVGYFDDEGVTDFYKEDAYAKHTRYDFWVEVIDLFKKNNIKSNLDMGCANNHFSFLCNKNDIFSLGVDPREDCVRTSDVVFKHHYGEQRYGYVGNFRTFIDFFGNYDQPVFDCVSILNFFHGNDHVPEEVEQMFNVLPKVTNCAILSEPKWDQLGLPKMTEKYEILGTVNNDTDHNLYKLN